MAVNNDYFKFWFSNQTGLNLFKYFGLTVGGTRSNVYKFAKSRTQEDLYSFSTQEVICKYYR